MKKCVFSIVQFQNLLHTFKTFVLSKFPFKSLLTLEWLLFLYIIAGYVVGYIVPIPATIKSILALPSWLIIPYFVGSFLRLIFRRLRFVSFAGLNAKLFSMIFGIYSLIIVTFLLDLFGLSSILVNLYLIVLGFAFCYLVYKSYRRNDDFLINTSNLKTYLPILLFCVLTSIIPAMMKISVPGFPYGTVEVISIPFEQTQPALRFMNYGYLQHPRVYDYVSLGITSSLFNIDPLSFIWASPLLMMFIFSVGLYLFTYGITKNMTLSFLTVFVGSFLNMNIFRDIPILFRANTILYSLLPFLLYLSYKKVSGKNYRPRDIILVFGLTAILIGFYVYLVESNFWSLFVPIDLVQPLEWKSHIWIPAITITTAPVLLLVGYVSRTFGKNSFLNDTFPFFLFISFFCFAFQEIESIAFIFFIFIFAFFYILTRNSKARLIIYAFIILIVAFITYQNFFPQIDMLNPISSVILPQYSKSLEIMPFALRFNWVFSINLSAPLVLLLILGVVVCLISKRKDYLLVSSAFLAALFLYLFPESYAYRFYKELTVVMAFVMAVGIWRLLVALSDLRKKYSTVIISALLITLLLPILITPIYTRYYQSSLGQSLLVEPEYLTTQWLKENTPENSIMVSDFVTMELLGTLSNRMLPIDRHYTVDGLSEESKQSLWHIKNMFAGNYLNISLENKADLNFWKSYSFGQGSIDISQTNISGRDNISTLRIIEGNRSFVGLIHKFTDKQDWSNASGIYIAWFGQNSSSTWQVCVAAPDDSNWFAFSFVDNFTGWKNVSAPFSSFSKVNSPDWGMISYIAIRTSNALPNTWCVGDIGLSYLMSLRINSEEISYLKNHVTSTEQRYCQQVGLALDNVSILIVITPRTVQWANQEDISETKVPVENTVDGHYLELIKKTSCLREMYSMNNSIYVFANT